MTMRYLLVVEKGEKNLSAFFPDVPGCVVMGDSIEETLQLAKEALEMHLEDDPPNSWPNPRTLPEVLADDLELDESVLLLSWVAPDLMPLEEAA